MSGGRRNTAVVVREYRTAPDSCVHALGLLLKSSVNKKAAERPTPDGRDGTKLQRDSADAQIISR